MVDGRERPTSKLVRMAQPAWIDWTRRGRSRRLTLRRRSYSRARTLLYDRSRARRWAQLMSLLISSLTHIASPLQTQHARRAALAARVALEGTAATIAEASLGAVPWQARLPGSVHRSFPLRYTAHLVTVVLVLIIVVTSSAVAPLVAHLPEGARAASISAPGASSDLAVERIMPAVVTPDDSLLAMPPVQALDDQFASAFVESHVVVEGETLRDIAAQYHISVPALFWSNDLQASGVFAAGQTLRVPRISGIPYIVEEGDTLEAIAQRFQVDQQAIVLFKANGVHEGQALPVGVEIFVPGGTLPYPDELLSRYGGAAGIATMRAVTAGTVQESDTNLRAGPGRDYPRLGYLDAGHRLKLVARHDGWVKVETVSGNIGWVRADLIGLGDAALASLQETNDFPPPPPRWAWPTHGTITSPFGWRAVPYRSFHDGLDIANKAWTEIRAARSGRVFEAGWCSGFGYCVKIDHGDGMTTIYGHLIKKPPVKVGASVTVGDVIGYMGSTFDARGGGYSTGVHLHFTVKVNGKAVNPRKFLP